jgi:hypothetical protein
MLSAFRTNMFAESTENSRASFFAFQHPDNRRNGTFAVAERTEKDRKRIIFMFDAFSE